MGGLGARHDTDRALTELLEEMRIAQMGGQISLGFLLSGAFTPVLVHAPEAEHELYAWAVGITSAAVILLLAPVPLHRLNFGRRVRHEILLVAHVLTLLGLAALACGIVLSVWLASRLAAPAASGVLLWWPLALLLATWLVVPLGLRVLSRDDGQDSVPERTS